LAELAGQTINSPYPSRELQTPRRYPEQQCSSPHKTRYCNDF